MEDRVPTKILPNGAIRYEDFDANGNSLGYRYTKRADEPTQEGTPICKATLLSDETAALHGKDGNAVPNDIFADLAKPVGTVKYTARTDLDDRWLLCNGTKFATQDYPDLAKLLPDGVATDGSRLKLDPEITIPETGLFIRRNNPSSDGLATLSYTTDPSANFTTTPSIVGGNRSYSYIGDVTYSADTHLYYIFVAWAPAYNYTSQTGALVTTPDFATFTLVTANFTGIEKTNVAQAKLKCYNGRLFASSGPGNMQSCPLSNLASWTSHNWLAGRYLFRWNVLNNILFLLTREYYSNGYSIYSVESDLLAVQRFSINNDNFSWISNVCYVDGDYIAPATISQTFYYVLLNGVTFAANLKSTTVKANASGLLRPDNTFVTTYYHSDTTTFQYVTYNFSTHLSYTVDTDAKGSVTMYYLRGYVVGIQNNGLIYFYGSTLPIISADKVHVYIKGRLNLV